LLARNPHLLQDLEHVRRHAFGQIDESVILADVDAADVLAVQARLVGDRADEVAGLHAVVVADFDAEGFEAGVGAFTPFLFALRPFGGVEFAARRPRRALLVIPARAGIQLLPFDGRRTGFRPAPE